MPKKETFTPSERRNLLKTGRLLHRQPELDIRSLKRDSESSRLPGRILIITPKKVGNAPTRNLLRRRLKALFHEEQLFLHSYDMVIYCRKGAASLSFADLKSILLTAFLKITASELQK